jgi:hypothetical protein
MDNYSPLNSLMNDHMLDLQDQFVRAHRNTKTADCNRLAQEIALISIAQSLTTVSEILDKYIHNDILDSNDREKDMQG